LFSPESLFVGKRDALEAALWAAIVALDERSDLARRVLRRVDSASPAQVHRYQLDIERSTEGAAVLKEYVAALMKAPPGAAEDSEGVPLRRSSGRG
jgi:hypothetical protein